MHTFAASGLLLGLLALGIVLWCYLGVSRAISAMAAMMIAMAAGMLTGLLTGFAGVLLGLELAPATAGALLVGMSAGLLSGVRASPMAALDGLLAGLMSGLMGPMTAVMFDHQGLTLLVGFVGWVSVLAALFMGSILRRERPDLRFPRAGSKWLALLAASALGLSLSMGHGGHPQTEAVGHSHTEPMYMAVRVESGKYTAPAPIQAVVGQPVRLVLHNQDQIPHEASILHLPAKAVHNAGLHPASQAGERIRAHALPRGTDEVTFTPELPGTYEVICQLPGHKERALLQVLPKDSAPH